MKSLNFRRPAAHAQRNDISRITHAAPMGSNRRPHNHSFTFTVFSCSSLVANGCAEINSGNKRRHDNNMFIIIIMCSGIWAGLSFLVALHNDFAFHIPADLAMILISLGHSQIAETTAQEQPAQISQRWRTGLQNPSPYIRR